MATKLAPHNLVPNADALRLVRAGAPVTKLVNDFGSAQEYLAINPNLLIIGRRISVFPDDPSRVITAENLRHLSPQSAAQLWIDIQSGTYRLNPLIRYWEGPNEPVWATQTDMAWYGEFEAERVLRLNTRGLFAIVGNFSTGTPHIQDNDLSWWQAFLPALQVAKQYSGILGLHEYSDGKLSKDFDGRYGWNTFRYRRVHDWFLAPNGLSNLPIVLTEFGVDFKIRDIDYVAELAWADSEMRKNRYLLGATIFTFGSTSPAWDDFNVDGSQVTTPLVAYMESVRDVPDPDLLPIPDPIPDPFPQPQEKQMQNLLFNQVDPATDQIYYNVRGIPEIAAPIGWNIGWYDQGGDRNTLIPGYAMPLPTQDQPFWRPETVVWPKVDAPANEQVTLFGNSPVLLKMFKGWAPIWCWLEQGLVLPAGQYMAKIEIFPDLYDMMNGNEKIWATDSLSGEFSLMGFDFKDGNIVKFGQWNTLAQTFSHAGGNIFFRAEFRGRHGLLNNGIFLRNPSVALIGSPVPTPTPTPTPQEQEVILTFDKQITVPITVKVKITVE